MPALKRGGSTTVCAMPMSADAAGDVTPFKPWPRGDMRPVNVTGFPFIRSKGCARMKRSTRASATRKTSSSLTGMFSVEPASRMPATTLAAMVRPSGSDSPSPVDVARRAEAEPPPWRGSRCTTGAPSTAGLPGRSMSRIPADTRSSCPKNSAEGCTEKP